MFAKKMIREGTAPQKAIYAASKYYDVDMSDVASYVGRKHNAKSGYAYAVVFAIGDEDDIDSPCGMKRYCRVHYKTIEKTISLNAFGNKNARLVWREQCDSDDFYGERSAEYAPVYELFVSDKLYNSKKEAEKNMNILIKKVTEESEVAE